MFSKKWQQRSVLFLLVAYSVDLIWKMAHWAQFIRPLRDGGWWGIFGVAVGLTIRFAVMGCCLWVYMRLRKKPEGAE
jgi:hypothetical protein